MHSELLGARQVSNAPSGQGWRVFQLAGIPLFIHPSWLFVLVLATLLFQRQYQGNVLLGLITALLLFLSVVLHELGHALVSQRVGVKVRSITLFMLGGVATMERDPPTPRGALLVAAAGPAVSALLAVLLAAGVHPLSHALPALGQMAFFLASLNAFLALFNLLPGLPLDGGQILKALVWQSSGSREKGVRVATRTPFSRLPLDCHTKALRIWPPSRGSPGSRLNRARNAFRLARKKAIWPRAGKAWLSGCTPAASNTASRALTAGPAAATSRAPRGVGGSRSMVATPPSMNRVMLRTFTPTRWDTRAWPSSCSTTERNSSRAVIKPSSTLPWYWRWNSSVASTSTNSQLG